MATGTKTIAQNRQAHHEYFILDQFEAGIELVGTEVKSIRQGRVNLKDAYCSIDRGELFLNAMHVSPYEQGNIFNRDPLRQAPPAHAQKGDYETPGQPNREGLTLIPVSLL